MTSSDWSWIESNRQKTRKHKKKHEEERRKHFNQNKEKQWNTIRNTKSISEQPRAFHVQWCASLFQWLGSIRGNYYWPLALPPQEWASFLLLLGFSFDRFKIKTYPASERSSQRVNLPKFQFEILSCINLVSLMLLTFWRKLIWFHLKNCEKHFSSKIKNIIFLAVSGFVRKKRKKKIQQKKKRSQRKEREGKGTRGKRENRLPLCLLYVLIDVAHRFVSIRSALHRKLLAILVFNS